MISIKPEPNPVWVAERRRQAANRNRWGRKLKRRQKQPVSNSFDHTRLLIETVDGHLVATPAYRHEYRFTRRTRRREAPLDLLGLDMSC